MSACLRCDKGYNCKHHNGDIRRRTALSKSLKKAFVVLDILTGKIKTVKMTEGERYAKEVIELKAVIATCSICKKFIESTNYHYRKGELKTGFSSDVNLCYSCQNKEFGDDPDTIYRFVLQMLYDRYQGKDTRIFEKVMKIYQLVL